MRLEQRMMALIVLDTTRPISKPLTGSAMRSASAWQPAISCDSAATCASSARVSRSVGPRPSGWS